MNFHGILRKFPDVFTSRLRKTCRISVRASLSPVQVHWIVLLTCLFCFFRFERWRERLMVTNHSFLLAGWNEMKGFLEKEESKENSSLPFVVNFLLRLHTLQLLTVIGKSFIFRETNGRWMKWLYHSRTEVLQIKSRHMLEWRSQLKNCKFSSKYAFPDSAQHEVEVKERGKHEWSNKVGEKLGKTDKNLFENFLFAFVSGANDSSSHNWLTVVLQREKKSNGFLPIALYANASSIFIVCKNESRNVWTSDRRTFLSFLACDTRPNW